MVQRCFTLLLVALFTSANALAAGEVEISFSPASGSHYENGEEISYSIEVKNTTADTIADVSVINAVWDVMSGDQKAFQSVSISDTHSLGSIAGSYASSNANLEVTGATLLPFGRVTYHVSATVSHESAENIVLGGAQVKAMIAGAENTFVDTTSVTFEPAEYKYTLDAAVTPAEYQVANVLTYTLTAKNTGLFAVKGLDITQPFLSLTGEVLSGANAPVFSHVEISAVASSGSNTGTFSKADDLSVENAELSVGGYITYTIKATVANDLVSDITTKASALTRDGPVESNVLVTPPATPNVTLTHTLLSSTPYLINGKLNFEIKVSNNGGAIAHGYHVTQNINTLLTNNGLANDLSSAFNNTDVTGNPFSTWTVTVNNIGSNSLSAYQASGVQTDVDFDDTVSIYPGESITYLVEATLTPITIGTLQGFSAAVKDESGSLVQSANVADTVNAEKVLNVSDSEIAISKTTTASEYVPGGNIEYEITVTNGSSKYFANNLLIQDNLTCVMTEQAGGAGDAQAFKEWKVEVISGEDSLGSDPGSYSYGSWSSNPIALTPDLAPGKTVKYKLTAKTNDASMGVILDDSTSCANDNVTESGSGVQTPDDNLRVSKDVDSRYYSSGQTLTYTIVVTNDGDGFANQVQVLDELSAITTQDINGNTINAYSDWTITANAYKADGTAATASNTGIVGAVKSPDNLNVIATLEPHSYIEYTIVADTHPLANGHIQNQVTVDGTVYADRGSDPRDFAIEVNKRVKTNTDTSFDTKQTSYSKLDNEVTFEISVKNAKENGYATNVQVKDAVSTITAEILEPNGVTKPVFKAWTISAEIKSDDPLLNGNPAYTDVGSFSDNLDLDTNAQIPPNVEVVYTIVAQIDRSNPDQILYSQFSNTATVKTPDSTVQSSASDSVTVYPKEPKIIVTKTTPDDEFIPGDWVTFTVSIFNFGEGYANEVHVTDDIVGLDAFSEWTIDATIDSNNSPYKTGSYAGPKSGYPNNGNIDSRIDIDPKVGSEKGSVVYVIHGRVKSDYAKQEISNTAQAYDPLTNLNQSSSAQIGDGSSDKLNVSILKTADKVRFVPGEDVTYEIRVLNNGSHTETGLKVVDKLQDILSVLANDKDNQYQDYPDQSPFEYWQFDYDDGAGFHSVTTENFVYPEGDASKTMSLEPDEVRTFKIKARVKDNVVGSLDEGGNLNDKIANDAYIYRDLGEVTETSHISHHEMKKAYNGGNVTRKLLVNGVESRFYSPGDTLTYLVTVSSQTGYVNDHTVSENITDVTTQLLDGSTATPFASGFSVDVSKSDAHGGDGTTDGTLDGTVANNQNISTVIDVAGGDSVTYQVEGVVREESVGNITIGGITVIPNSYHLSFSKTVDEASYEPGKPLVYRLTIENDGKGNAYNIPVVDRLSNITVELVDGTSEKAFDSGWTIEQNIVSGSDKAILDLDGSVENNRDIDTHASIPAGTTIEYKVTATVNNNAVGEILNLLTVDGDTVSAKTKASAEKYDFEKHITRFLDQDGVTSLSGGYTPGGYIEYEISLVNLNNVHMQNMPIKDELSAIKTQYLDGSMGAAFDSWTISTQTDTSGISEPGSVTDNRDIDTQFNLAANSFAVGGTFIKYTVKAKISEKAVGQILNVAVIDNSHNLVAEPANMLRSEVSKSHKAYTDSSLSSEKLTYNHTSSGENIVYRLRLQNNGKGLEYNKSLQELFSSIKVRVAQNAAGESDAQSLPAFAAHGWEVSVKTSGEATTDVGGFVGGANADIDIPVLSIAPGGWIEFVMKSRIRPDALDQIASTPKYDGTNFATARVTPEGSNLAVNKEIVSIAGKPYAAGDTYKPEDEVVYKFTVTNTEPVWRDEAAIQDIISNVRVEVIGDTTKSAFSESEISHVFTSVGTSGTQDTYIEPYDATDDLDLVVDIAPEEVIEFTVKGKVRADAVGDIDGNTAKAGNQSDTTETIPPVAPVLDFQKLVLNTTADSSTCTFPSSTGTDCHYNPNGQIQYQVSVTNVGESTTNGATIVDELDKINTSDGKPAFTDYSVAIVSAPTSERFSINGQYQGNVPLNAAFDLMPGDTVVFEIDGTVAADATGAITNVAKVAGVDSNAVVLDPGTSNLLAQKSTDTPTYTPGSEVRYQMRIRNVTSNNELVDVRDTISSYLVETADGTEKVALKDWSVSASVISDGNPAYTDINNLNLIADNTDIDTTIQMGGKAPDDTYTEILIEVVGHVRDDAVGEFTNQLQGKLSSGSRYVTYNLREKVIVPEPGNLAVTKITTDPAAIYHPGDTIGYDIEVKNTGSGYATDVLIADLWKTIRTEKAGSALPVRAFEGWSDVSVSVDGTDPSLTQAVSGSEVTGDNGYQVRYNIHPAHSVKLHVEGVVKADLVGNITNVVEVSDATSKQAAQATFVAAAADLNVTKIVDKTQYESGDMLTYTIQIENTTANWANDVQVKDFVNKITAASVTGADVIAFESGTIYMNAESLSGATKFPAANDEFIDGSIDIAPNDVVTITVEGELNSQVVGEVTNTVDVTYNGTTKTAEATSTAKIPDLTFTKTPMVEHYSPNKVSGYILKIVNEGNNYANDINLKDAIGALTVDTIDGSTNQAFLQWAVQYVAGSGLTTVDANSLVVDKDIDYNIDLAPNDSITLYVIGLVNAQATGDIVNQATLNYNGKDILATATLKPYPGDVVIEKSADERYYQPGEFSTFRVKVTNNGSGFAADVKVEDLISALEVETSGGAMEAAFNDWTIVTSKGDPRTNIETLPGPNSDISTNLDIAPGDTVEFAIAGTVNSRAVANIINTATAEFAGATTEATATLETLPEEVWIEKTAESPMYIPGEDAVFHVRVYNGTDGFDNDIALEDILSGIKATNIYGVSERAFESWTIETTSSDSRTTITPMPVDNQDIRSMIDIAPHDIVEFTITAKTNPLAASDITNTATADLNGTQQHSSATVQPQSQGISIEKTADTQYYVPGAEATFRVKVKNEGTVPATDVAVKDAISNLEVVRLDGTSVKAFDSWRIEVNKANAETEITNMPGVNSDIDSTLTIAANDEVEFVITGLVNQYATGEIENTASATFRGETQDSTATLLAMPESVKLEKTVDDEFYRPGESVTYHVVLTNESGSFTEEMVLKDLISELKVNTINDTQAEAFTSWRMTSSYNDERTIVLPQIQGDNLDVNSRVILAPNDTLDIEITGVVNADAMGEITNHAYAYDKSESDVLAEDVAIIKPQPIILSVTKVADKAEYTNDDEEITFTMTATNRGSGDAESVNLLDEIDKLIGSNGNALFTTWKATITELKSGVVVSVDSDNNVNSNHTLKAYQGNEFEIVVTGEINQGIDDNFTNVFTAAASTGETASANVTIKVKKQAYNEGMLKVTKVASKSEASVGEVVEYEVVITNENDNPFSGVRLVDRYPGGFAYIPDSTEMVNSGPDGVFDTSDDIQITVEPTKTNQLFFDVGDMNIYGKGDSQTADAVRIRYLMRVSVGATFGVYTNTAWAEAPPAESFSAQNTSTNYVVKSNLASATVEVMPDKVFDTASIIGKVFEDHNGDGFQADATADDVLIDIDLALGDYVPNSTFIIQDGVETQLKDVTGKLQGQPVVMSRMDKGYEVDELYGLSRNRTLKQSNQVAFQFKTRTRQGFSFKVTTDNGTHIEFDQQGNAITKHKGDKQKGLSAENIDVVRNLYRDGDEYLWEIVVENKGLYEDGIPGVRLLTVEGIIIETDQYGRYHVPDQWVLNKKGKQFLVKVDTDSLPTGMKVISENPKVQRITPNKLTKFNFSIQSSGDD
ncbi:DUF11 domain-containing protein [Vibrio parahaemolyticus]|uniref:DUF11 domain-containing protein n=1 Tax=Vibrio parahaemolyticus TaxID=670 RepID=UPI001F2919AD|nr:DUF11 domain-containing protein [Vibrio parahaemolyticus]MCG0012468.1 DUF11 domain-containing protein [Vibrio parahaemolyticus]MDL1997888.1 DUF11 domain-containing protein [Vibrio parahaemolyticus]